MARFWARVRACVCACVHWRGMNPNTKRPTHIAEHGLQTSRMQRRQAGLVARVHRANNGAVQRQRRRLPLQIAQQVAQQILARLARRNVQLGVAPAIGQLAGEYRRRRRRRRRMQHRVGRQVVDVGDERARQRPPPPRQRRAQRQRSPPATSRARVVRRRSAVRAPDARRAAPHLVVVVVSSVIVNPLAKYVSRSCVFVCLSVCLCLSECLCVCALRVGRGASHSYRPLAVAAPTSSATISALKPLLEFYFSDVSEPRARWSVV